MNDKRKTLTFMFAGILICIIATGLFIYPGIYKYDKFDQRLPVKINRFTGHTEILTYDGWEDVGKLQPVETETSPAQ